MKLLILDRDGVINYDSDAYIKTLEEWVPIPGSVAAIAQAMHARLRALVAEQGGEVGHIVYCPHGPDEGCDCRKPKPGMLRAIAEHYQVGLEGVWFVGDSKGDLEAALAVGAQPVLVKTGKGERTLEKGVLETTLIFDDLAAIARELI